MNDTERTTTTAGSGKEPLSRETIIAEARKIVATGGLDQLSLRRLASHLGVTAPALYAHVDDKGDLLRAIAKQGFADLVDRYRDIDVDDPVERLRALSSAYIEQALEQPEVFRLMFHFRPHGIEIDESIAFVDNELDAATEAFEYPYAAVVEAIAAGRFHPDRDPLITSLTLWTATHGVAVVMHMGIAFDDTGRVALERSVMDSVIAGLALPPT